MGNPARNIHGEDLRDRQALIEYFDAQTFKRWRTSREIRFATGLTPIRIRQLAQIYPCLLVSSVEGYKLTRHATKQEVRHCVQSLLQRSEKIMARASALTGSL